MLGGDKVSDYVLFLSKTNESATSFVTELAASLGYWPDNQSMLLWGGAWYGRESGSRASKYWHLLHFVATISAPLTEPLKNDHKIPNNNKTRREDKINVFSILLISNILSICVGGSGGKPQKSPQWKQIVPAGVESAKGKIQNTQENTTTTTTKEAAHREEEEKRKGKEAQRRLAKSLRLRGG